MPIYVSSSLCCGRKTPVIPPKRIERSNALRQGTYKARHLMENFYCKLNSTDHSHPLR